MAVKIPFSLIRKFQAAIREEAGVPSYDPTDPALHGFPTLQEAIAGLDRSTPPYLRCNRCKAKLLRGLQSTLCVYCGAEQRRDGVPLSISFNSTVGYRKLLESLDLDGSEPVAVDGGDSRDSSKAHDALKDGLVLSGLLDIELSWPPEKEEVQSSSTSKVPAQSATPVNLSGVDLDNFFSETKAVEATTASSVSQEVVQKGQILSTETHASSDPGSFGFFENLRSADTAVHSADTTSGFGDSFADWEADFQSAGSVMPAADSKSIDLFQGSVPDAPDKPTDREFEINSRGSDQKPQNEVGDLASTMDDSNPDGLWQTADTGMPSTAYQSKNNSTPGVGEVNSSNDFLSMTDISVQGDLWPHGSSNVAHSNEKNGEDDDSFDAWQDFTSSQGASKASSYLWTGVGEESKMQSEHSCEVNLFDQTMLDDMDFGSFSQSDSFSGVSAVNADSADMKNRMHTVEGNKSLDAETLLMDSKNENFTAAATPPTSNPQVEDLLSGMNDLSFMLESNLSIPENVKSSDSAS